MAKQPDNYKHKPETSTQLPSPTQLPPPPRPPPPLLPAFDFSSLPDVPQTMPDVSRNMFELKVETEPFDKIEALLKQEEKPVMGDKLNKMFPEAANIFQETPTETAVKNEISIPNLQKITSELERGAVPKELMFFRGGENVQLRKKLDIFGLNVNIETFLNYLELGECSELLKRSKMSIHMKTCNIFFDNVNNGETILDFIAAQQDYDKKLL